MIQCSRRPHATPEAPPRISPGQGRDGPRVSCPGGGGGLGLRSDPRAPGLALRQRRAGRAHGVRAEHGGALGRHLVLLSPEPAVHRRHLLLHHQRADPTRHRPLSPLYRHRSPGRVPRRSGSQRHSPVRHRHRLQFPRRAAPTSGSIWDRSCASWGSGSPRAHGRERANGRPFTWRTRWAPLS